MGTKGSGKQEADLRQRFISLVEFADLCDDPARDRPGRSDVRAILDLYPDVGFFLSARDGARVYQVVDVSGQQVRFRTIEGALQLLQDVHHLSADISVIVKRPL